MLDPGLAKNSRMIIKRRIPARSICAMPEFGSSRKPQKTASTASRHCASENSRDDWTVIRPMKLWRRIVQPLTKDCRQRPATSKDLDAKALSRRWRAPEGDFFGRKREMAGPYACDLPLPTDEVQCRRVLAGTRPDGRGRHPRRCRFAAEISTIAGYGEAEIAVHC